MKDTVLSHFPTHTHALTLVNDPDEVLADEAVLAALAARGCTIVREADPVALRHRVEQARPWTLERPLIVVTAEPLKALPYDLWQQGHHVTLALHTFFPRLSYPEVKALTPAQRARLGDAPTPEHTLGRRSTGIYLLRHVFDAQPAQLRQPAALLTWLETYHRQPDPMPPALQELLLESLEAEPSYAHWPLRELLTHREAFTEFVQTQWERYLHAPPGGAVAEARVAYLDFAGDAWLQDILGRLVRSGTLTPVPVTKATSLPPWTLPGILADESERLPQRLSAALEDVQALLAALPAHPRWTDWQPFAWAWAELTATYYHPDLSPDEVQAQSYRRLREQLDERFTAWVQQRYAALAIQRLPAPHHLYHLPHYLAHRYPPDQGHRVALIILDGLALADWTVIRRVWKARYPHRQWEEHLVLAQIPTLTSVSRQALVSGLRPRDFAESLTSTRHDSRRWRDFWLRHGLDANATPYVRLRERDAHAPAELTSAHSRAICVVDVTVDESAHHATLGARDFYSSLHLWLQEDNRYLEQAIAELLARDFVVVLTSDHGHTGAVGMGRPSEGIVAETRGKRARLYEDRRLAENVRQQFPDTLLWNSDGLLPDDLYALLPRGRKAFVTHGDRVVSHGGATLDEVIVPFVIIT